MSARRNDFTARPLVLALQGALAVMAALPLAAHAQDDDVATLINPTSTIELGAGYNSKASDKFGEYTGLTRKGADFIGNLDLYGGDGYGQGSGTLLMHLRALDLGTASRRVDATLAQQGSWQLGFTLDDIRHAYTDTYETPMQGRMGGNVFVIPPSFGVVSTAAKPVPYGTQALTDAQKALFHGFDVHTDRHTTTLSGGVDFDKAWNFRMSWSHVAQSGAKLLGSGTDGNVQAVGATLAGYSPGRESIQLLMNPTDYQTDNINATVNWVGEKAFASVSYFGSHFTDAYTEVQFSNPYTSAASVTTGSLLGTAFPVDALSTMPNSMLNQLDVRGGYDFSARTHLVGGLSISDNTQNQPYVNLDQMQAGGLPRASLDGRVITKHADLRLTDRSIDRLTLGAAVRFNERDNRTASATYDFLDLGKGLETSVNTPLSNRRTQAELTGDIRVARGQNLHLGFEYDKIDRWCENALANEAQGSLSATNAGYYTTASCVQVPRSTDNTTSAEYRLALGDSVHLKLGGAYASRNSRVNPSFYNPMQANEEGFENFGYVAFFDASRREKSGKAAVDWQVTRGLDLSLSGKVARDEYTDSPLGVQGSRASSANFDATYEIGEHASVAAFATWQRRTRDLFTANGRNAVAALPNLWTNELSDTATTAGISARQDGLLGGRLSLKGDFVHSLARTGYQTALQYVSATCTAPSNGGYTCGALPDVRSVLSQVKLTGTYQVDKHQAVVLGYQYQKLDAADYFYNYYQMGYTATSAMPANLQPPGYSQNRFFVVYRYSFR